MVWDIHNTEVLLDVLGDLLELHGKFLKFCIGIKSTDINMDQYLTRPGQGICLVSQMRMYQTDIINFAIKQGFKIVKIKQVSRKQNL